MSDFFNIFDSCCGERKPKKVLPESNGDNIKKQVANNEAPLYETPRALPYDSGIEYFLKKCSDEFRSTLSPIPSVGSSLESPCELSPFELSFSSLLESCSPPRTTPPSRAPSPTPRDTLLEIIGDLLSSSTPPHSPRKSKDNSR